MRKIYVIHQWVSLICALFLLLLVQTGLPLLFRSEIRAWNTVNLPMGAGPLPQEEMWQAMPAGLAAIEKAFPGKQAVAVTPDFSEGMLYVLVKDTAAEKTPRAHMRMGGEQIMYDVRSGALFNRSDRVYRFYAVDQFLHVMHALHVRLGMEEGGRDFLATMCVLSVISVVSGYYLYAPLMGRLPFGARRRKSSRLFWSDWHKLFSAFAGAWTVVMCLSGIFIVLYSVGIRHYEKEAYATAASHFAGQEMQTTEMAEPSAALARVQEAFPQKIVISMHLSGASGYSFHLADPPTRMTDFMLGELAFLPPSGDGEPLFVPVPPWLTMAPFFLNIHIHNHVLLAEKLFWALLIFVTAAMIFSGLFLFFTRWRNVISSAAEARQKERTTETWEEPARIVILSLIICIAPLYGTVGDGLALALMLYLIYFFFRALRG